MSNQANLVHNQLISITVDGRSVSVQEGVSVAAVLLAAGERVFRRTRQAHEPRGPFCGMGVCYDCLVTVDGVPNVRACMTAVREEMVVETQSGFRIPGSESTPAHGTELGTQNTELAVIGAGPAGLEAALAAAEVGVQVTLIDSAPQAGGQYFKQPLTPAHETSPQQAQADALFQRLTASPVQHLVETLVWGVFPAEDGGWLLALDGPNAPRRLHAQTIILAPGAYDRPIAFPGWTLPGVITAGAVQTLAKTQGVLPGRRFLFAGSGPLQLVAAAEVVKAGGEVAAVLEAAPWSKLARPGHLPAVWGQWQRLSEGWRAWRTLRRAGVPIRFGWAMTAARGETEVEAVDIARLDDAWRPIPGSTQTLAVDTLVLGFGFLPATQLTRLLGCEHAYRPQQGGWVPVRDHMCQTSLPGIYTVGDGAGIGGAALARCEGRIAGLAAAQRLRGTDTRLQTAIAELQPGLGRERRFAQMLGQLFTPGPGLYTLADDDTILCRCEEVRWGEVQAAQAAGCSSLTEIKGLTRVGMGNCQGRICGELVAQALVTHLPNEARWQRLQALGQFSVRPPIHPLTVEKLAGSAE